MTGEQQGRYCVVCRQRESGLTRVVGPFFTQEAAVVWAANMRTGNRAWNYTPEVMDPPS